MSTHIENLQRIAESIKRQERKAEQLLAERDAAIDAAREAPKPERVTWRAIAGIYGMTEHGIIKSLNTRKKAD